MGLDCVCQVKKDIIINGYCTYLFKSVAGIYPDFSFQLDLVAPQNRFCFCLCNNQFEESRLFSIFSVIFLCVMKLQNMCIEVN